MNKDILSKPQYILESKELPFSLIPLKDWQLVLVEGQDSINYLQGQLTIDLIKNFDINNYKFCAHCNGQGKVLSTLILFSFNYREKLFGYILRKSISKIQQKELKKYSVFSKVKIFTNNKLQLLGIAGFNARNILKSIFNILPNKNKPFIKTKDISFLWFNKPIERFILISSYEKINFLKKKFFRISEYKNSLQWLSLDIEAGYPIIEKENIKKFLPQSLNSKFLKSIDLKKGCYLGQEVIARTTFLNTNKKFMYFLSGYSNFLPKIGDKIEAKINKKWISIGDILAIVKLKNKIFIQAVLKTKNFEINQLRIENYNSNFLIKNI